MATMRVVVTVVWPTVVWPSIVKGKSRGERPSPPPIVISRWRWSGVIPDHWSRRATDFFDCFLYQLTILPNPLPHFPAIGVICPFRNSFNCMAAFVIINHRFTVPGGISGCLIILIYSISDQGPNNSSRSQTDKSTLRVASNRLANKSTRTRTYCRPYLGIVSVRGIMSA
jgi:hypothetical protein